MGKDLTGRKLESFVAILEGALAGTSASIHSRSRHLIDRDTGRPREHDVVITWDHGHHRMITAIECRDRSRPVGVPDVEAFADKCASTGVNSGVIVSATGFRNSARIKASARSITCMDLSEVAQFNWLAMEAFSAYERQFGHVEVTIMLKDAEPDELSAVFDANQNELSNRDIVQAVIGEIPPVDEPEAELGRIIPVELRLQPINWTVRDGDGQIWKVDHILATTSSTMKKTVMGVETHRYTGGGRDYAIASTDVAIGEVNGKILMVRNEDDSTSIYWNSHG